MSLLKRAIEDVLRRNQRVSRADPENLAASDRANRQAIRSRSNLE